VDADSLLLHDPTQLPLSLELALSPTPAAASLAVSTYLWEARAQAQADAEASSGTDIVHQFPGGSSGPLQGQPIQVVQLACEMAALSCQPALAWAALAQGAPELASGYAWAATNTPASQKGEARSVELKASIRRRLPHLMAALAAAGEAAVRSSRA